MNSQLKGALITKLDRIGNLLYAINLKLQCKTCQLLREECSVCLSLRDRMQEDTTNG